jgi:hypothetical protein
VTGFLVAEVWGRPRLPLALVKDGSLLIGDDTGGDDRHVSSYTRSPESRRGLPCCTAQPARFPWVCRLLSLRVTSLARRDKSAGPGRRQPLSATLVALESTQNSQLQQCASIFSPLKVLAAGCTLSRTASCKPAIILVRRPRTRRLTAKQVQPSYPILAPKERPRAAWFKFNTTGTKPRTLHGIPTRV